MTTTVAHESSEKSEPLALPQLEALSSEERRRLEVIQRLESHRGQSTYREAETEAALNIAIRCGNAITPLPTSLSSIATVTPLVAPP